MVGNVVEQITWGIADAEGVELEDLSMAFERYVSVDAMQTLVDHKVDSFPSQFEVPNHVVELVGRNTILVDGNQI